VYFVEDWADSSPTHPFYVCDVFTDRALQGNQLGVFVDGRPFTDDERQRLARELNFAETVFLFPPEQGGDARVRIFTPALELPFAGHPVLGTAFVVGSARGLDHVTLEVPAGVFGIARDGRFGRMQQRFAPPEPYDRERELLDALGVAQVRLPVEVYRNGPSHVFVALRSEDEVTALRPDAAALQELNVAANCFAGGGSSWKTRMFYPAQGIPEDAATGSAAGPLAAHLVRHGELAAGEEIEIRQGIELGRPSYLYARTTADGAEVGGNTVLVAEGRYRSG
jgi:trans-2,3-dihydro-3-hydroxyanthranilate isomerase